MVSPLYFSDRPLIFNVKLMDHHAALVIISLRMQLVHEIPLVTLDRTKEAIVEPLAEAQSLAGILIVEPQFMQLRESGWLLRESLDLGSDEESGMAHVFYSNWFWKVSSVFIHYQPK